MKNSERRDMVLLILKDSKEPVKGGELSKRFEVSRQVIVQDIALLRAEGKDIIATPQGYLLLTKVQNSIRRVVAVKHSEAEVEDELLTIISMGGRVIDVTIEHKVYGELTGKLMLKSKYDVEQFMEQLKGVKPLSNLTEGIHIHTIEADNDGDMKRILNALKGKGYLIEKEL